MAKFCLIKSRPRSRETDIAMPLSCLYLAASLRRAGHEVTGVINALLPDFSLRELQRHLAQQRPDVVGISALTAEASFAHLLAAFVKKSSPQTKVLMGGHYPSNDPERALADPQVDFCILGEGEEPIVRFAEALERGNFDSCPALAFQKEGSIVKTPSPPLLQDLDRLPYPSWDLLNFDRYTLRPNPIVERAPRRYAVLFTSRGCPYRCEYCHDLHGKTFRPRSVENVLGEMALLYHKYGVREFHIMDDIFNFDLERAKNICRGVLKWGLRCPLYFGSGLRAEWIDEEFLKLLKETGTDWICFGIDSGVPRIQRLIGRNLDLKKTKEVIAHARRYGLFTKGNFIMGFPSETREEMEKTTQWMVESDLDAVDVAYLTPIPGSQFGRKKVQETKDLQIMYDGHTYMLITKNFSSVTDQELTELRDRAYLKFYFSRKRLRLLPFHFLHWKTVQALPHLKRIFLQKAERRPNGWHPRPAEEVLSP